MVLTQPELPRWFRKTLPGQDRKGNDTQLESSIRYFFSELPIHSSWDCVHGAPSVVTNYPQTFALLASPSLPRVRSPMPISAGCRRSEVGCLDEAFTLRNSGNIFVVFGSTSRFLCRQFNSHRSTTFQLVTVIDHIHLSSTPYIRVMWPCLLRKRVRRRIGAPQKRMMRPASRY